MLPNLTHPTMKQCANYWCALQVDGTRLLARIALVDAGCCLFLRYSCGLADVLVQDKATNPD